MHEVQLPAVRPGAYAAPATLPEALAMLSDGGRVVAGGTDLMIEMDRRISGEVERLIDITRIAGLNEISVVDDRGASGAPGHTQPVHREPGRRGARTGVGSGLLGKSVLLLCGTARPSPGTW